MREQPYRMHYIWDYERNTGICWCGEDHADDSGNHGPIPEDQWIPADDPRVGALLDDMYAEAWLGHDHNTDQGRDK